MTVALVSEAFGTGGISGAELQAEERNGAEVDDDLDREAVDTERESEERDGYAVDARGS